MSHLQTRAIAPAFQRLEGEAFIRAHLMAGRQRKHGIPRGEIVARLGKMRSDIAVSNRPQLATHGGARFKVDSIIGKATPAPQIGRATKATRHSNAHVIVTRGIGKIRRRQILNLVIGGIDAGLEHHNRLAQGLQFKGKRNTNRP